MYRMRFLALAAVVCAATAFSAKADSMYSVTVSAATGVSSSCMVGATGTLDISSSGGVYLAAPSGSTMGCYIGAPGSQPGGTPTVGTPISIGGAHPDGTAAQLNSFADHTWYAELDQECGGLSQCTSGPNNSTNDTNSADLDILINNSSSPESFTVYDTSGNADTIANGPGPASCTGVSGTTTFTVAAHTICFEDLSTGASIVISTNTPTVPEPASVALLGSGLVLTAGLLRRRRRSR